MLQAEIEAAAEDHGARGASFDSIYSARKRPGREDHGMSKTTITSATHTPVQCCCV